MTAGELANLERCYATLLPLLVDLGDRQVNYVVKFGEEYIKYFPNGKSLSDVQNAVNKAKVKGGRSPAEEAKPAAAPVAEPAEDEESVEPMEPSEEASEEASEEKSEATAEEKSEEKSAEEEPAAEEKESEGDTANE